MRGLGDKQLIREINFPNKVDSVCFLNEEGDLVVGHEQRLSVIRFKTYWPFRKEAEKGTLQIDTNAEVVQRDAKSQSLIKKTEIRD